MPQVDRGETRARQKKRERRDAAGDNHTEPGDLQNHEHGERELPAAAVRHTAEEAVRLEPPHEIAGDESSEDFGNEAHAEGGTLLKSGAREMDRGTACVMYRPEFAYGPL